MLQKTPTESDRIKFQIVGQDDELKDFDYSLIPPGEIYATPVDNIWEYDGSAGCDTRPEIVKQDDENIRQGRV